jgi:uncharacterized protein with FMN-binding domain
VSQPRSPGPGRAQPPRRARANPWKSRSGRITYSLAGLSSAAILSVYSVGYLRTQAGEPGTAPLSSQTTAATATPTPTLTPQRGQRSSAPAPTATPAPAKPGAGSATAYRDGSYSGLGTSRHGNIQVTVVVQGGKIASAEVSSCMTRYPCSKISSLPGRVLAAQKAVVDHVSGATDSSNAYNMAVANALKQAV